MTEGRQEPDGAPSERPVTLSAIVPASVAGVVQGQAQAREPPIQARRKLDLRAASPLTLIEGV